MKSSLLRLVTGAVVAALFPFAAQAAPVMVGSFLFSENRGATSVFDAGHYFLIGSNSITPSGPGTTVTATHVPSGGPDYSPVLIPSPLFPNLYATREAYAGQTGSWNLTASDSSGSTTVSTHVLDDVRVIPLVTGLALSGSVLAPHLTWNGVDPTIFPSFCGGGIYGPCALGYDFFQYQVEVRQITGVPGNPAPFVYVSSSTMYTSGLTEFDIPTGVLSMGNEYLIGVRLNHFELEAFLPSGGFFSPLENRSVSYIEVAPVPEPETYAMLLAGLGLLGFAARRRKLKEITAA